MSSQLIHKVDTPTESKRKRHLSISDSSDTTPKKARNCESGQESCSDGEGDNIGDAEESRQPATDARRKLYRKTSTRSPRKVVVTEADVHVSAQPSVEQLIAKLSSDMNMMFLSLNERFDKMESGLEQRISSKVAQLLDKRVNSELSKIRKDVNDRMDDFKESIKADLAADLDEIRDELASRQPTLDTVSQNTKDLSLNIVIRNLPENSNENIKNKVNALFKDGLRLSDVSVSDAERKQSRSESKPGVVIAKLKNKNDKQRVMKEKSKLKDSRRFSKVFIHHDQVPSQRSVSSNFRAILRAMKVNNSNLSMRGSRVVYTESSDDQGSRRDNSRDSSRDQRTDYHNSRRDGGMSGSHRNDNAWSNKRDGRLSDDGEWTDASYSRRDGRNAPRKDTYEHRSRSDRQWRD